ncbi:HupE/UreJ family protein [Gramella sp. AN32]|uniref:HupE/UreJ family protein n=1 Tax=Christiangramia antarctica TaxID=2058158 RepID=A0ABW5X8X3_9FLAO|nr:HupE/UreJ family protein [Gramella sp. AN32]MCM4157331.1 HupE / UreJ protein [Gramella sp. AN32]
MSQFQLYFELGLKHVLDWNAYDHVMFLIVLVAGYNFNSWRKVLLLVSLFTLGHTIALFLAAYGVINFQSSLVEFLIPVTILITALYNIFIAKKKPAKSGFNLLYITTLFFGIIHGLGFSTYFKMIAAGAHSKILPLLEFALGIELAQVIVVLSVLILAYIFQNFLKVNRRDWILITSSIVIGVILPILQKAYVNLSL